MNNECFKIGVVTLGVQCGPYASVNFEVHVVVVLAKLELSQPTNGEARTALSGPDLVHTLVAATDPPPPPLPSPALLPRAKQVCPGEWVYHYIDTADLGAGHYGANHHLRYTITKPAADGAAVAITRHLKAPLKVTPPYVALEYSSQAVTASIEICDVEPGPMYIGIRGVDNEAGCMHYAIATTEFMGDCQELLHQPVDDPAAIADKTLPVEPAYC